MTIKTKKVLVTLDSMKNPNTGLYHFGQSLGTSLNNLQKKDDRIKIDFYIAKRGRDIFEGDAQTIRHSEWHKYYFSKAGDYDVVHFTDQVCRLQPSKVRARKVLTIHDLNQLHETTSLSKNSQKHLGKVARYIDECDKIVAISKFVARDIETYFPNSRGKIEVIYNGADQLSAVIDHSPVYLPKKPFLFALGEILPKKNFHVLPNLLKGNEFELLIAGNLKPDGYSEKIFEAARFLNCEDRVKILGPVSDEDKTWYYQHCEAFTFPSIAEGFGLPIIEAMHFGKPVFLSTKTAVPEIGGDLGFYFPDFNPETMQKVFNDGMTTYRNTPDYGKRLISRALEFSWDRAAKKYVELYLSF